MSRRINPKTGVFEEEDSFLGIPYWTESKNEDGNAQRINTKSGVFEEEDSFLGIPYWNSVVDRTNNTSGNDNYSDDEACFSPAHNDTPESHASSASVMPTKGTPERTNGLSTNLFFLVAGLAVMNAVVALATEPKKEGSLWTLFWIFLRPIIFYLYIATVAIISLLLAFGWKG